MYHSAKVCLLIFGVSAFSVSQQPSAHILNRFVAAFNAHNTEAMLTYVSDSVIWFSINNDSQNVEMRGKEALREWMQGYFRDCPSCRTEFLSVQEAGRFVSVYEKASWKGKKGERSQKSLGIYEIVNSTIRRVWYYPAEQ